MSDAVLYGYWRSSAAYRVRIASNLKGLAPQQVFVHLRKGEQRSPEHLARNPSGLLPTWREGDFLLSQSLAILEYLDETHPEPPLLPGDARNRARIRELALIVVADIHPVGNLRVLAKLAADHGADEAMRAAWNRRWIGLGFSAIETQLARSPGAFCCGEAPTLADVCLVPQVYNARRFGLDLAPYPHIVRVDAHARQLKAFADASPEAQPDAE